MPLAYSYVRFSTEKQKLGHSLKRQVDAAEEYAAQHGLVLDTSTYFDAGVSAFKSKNLVEGKLGKFLQACDDGHIPAGSFLLVESLDRLSRADVDVALELFLSIIRRGITIVTLADKQVYSAETIKKDRGIGLIISITVMIRANEESLIKSDRGKKKWAEKRASGKLITNNLPSWLKVVDDKWVVDEHKKAVLNWIFDRSIVGDGAPTIAKKLNTGRDVPEAWLQPHPSDKNKRWVPTFRSAEEWTNSVIAAYLKNPAVYGTMQHKSKLHDPVPGYYPVVVEESKFIKARDAISRRLHKGGRKGTTLPNLFSAITYCECGRKMRIVSNSDYLRCTRAFNQSHICDAPRVPIQPIEEAVLRRFMTQNRDLLRATESEDVDPKAAVLLRIQEQQKRIDNLMEMIARRGYSDASSRMLDTEEQTMRKLQKDLEAIPPAAPRLEITDVWDLIDSAKATSDPDKLKEHRLRLQVAIRRILKRVTIFKDRKTFEVEFNRTGTVRQFTYETPASQERDRDDKGRYQPGNVRALKKIG